MISSRYALPVILLLALALLPTIIHNYLGSEYDDGKSVQSIPTVLAGFSSEPYTRHKDSWAKSLFDSEDWIERIYKNDKGEEVRLFAARSYDYKRLYHHPELALSYRSNLKKEGVVMLSGDPEIPVFLLRDKRGYGVVAYALLHKRKLIKDPILYQINEVISQLFLPKRAMTLFYVSDKNSPASDKFNKTFSASILAAAIKSFNPNEAVGIKN
jgi:hypothetical protein